MTRSAPRSACPINLAVETIGDGWSLVVLRDIVFGGRRHFRDLLGNSLEGIASNILADRLKSLTEAGLLTRAPDPRHRQRVIYSLTEAGIALVPALAVLGDWGLRHRAPSPELAIRARLLAEGGPPLWAAFMDELRALHLGAPAPAGTGPSVSARLQAAYEAALAGSGAAPARKSKPSG